MRTAPTLPPHVGDAARRRRRCAGRRRAEAVRRESTMPRLVQKDGRYALLVDGAPFLMLGAQVNNSSAWPAVLPEVWPAIKALHANTVEMPVYWEQFEPKPGAFDYSVVDTLVTQSRKNGVRLVLLWFATWKNNGPAYVPLWLKQDPQRFARMLTADGRPLGSISPFSTEMLEADKHAFAALMRHLKKTDPQHTVILVQVENESGTWGAVRDYSPAAVKAFDAPVPAPILAAMGKKPAGPNVANVGWKEAFGKDADEFFHAWAVARYVGEVAAAGKAEYPLPLYANAALRDPIAPGPTVNWESGGPTDDVLPIWKAAAPALDLLAPDIYMDDYAKVDKVMELYRRPDNPLLIPEISNAPALRALLLPGARPRGARVLTVRDRLHEVRELSAGREEDERGGAGAVRAQLPARRPDDARARPARLRGEGSRRRREERDARAEPGDRRLEGQRLLRPPAVRLRRQPPGEPRARRAAPSSPSSPTISSWWPASIAASTSRRPPPRRRSSATTCASRKGPTRTASSSSGASGTATRPTGASTSPRTPWSSA